MQLSVDGSSVHVMDAAASAKAEQLRASQLVMPNALELVGSPTTTMVPAAKAHKTLQAAVAKAATFAKAKPQCAAVLVPEGVIFIIVGSKPGAGSEVLTRRS